MVSANSLATASASKRPSRVTSSSRVARVVEMEGMRRSYLRKMLAAKL
jgi:hypothetical protein